jgi:hypothetical protein
MDADEIAPFKPMKYVLEIYQPTEARQPSENE